MSGRILSLVFTSRCDTPPDSLLSQAVNTKEIGRILVLFANVLIFSSQGKSGNPVSHYGKLNHQGPLIWGHHRGQPAIDVPCLGKPPS